MKPASQSKTVAANVLTVALCLIPGAREAFAEYPELLTIAVALMNIGLRFLTRDSIKWFF